MRITVEGRTYQVDREGITNRELMVMERFTGLTSDEMALALERGSVVAATALVWLARHREEPGLAVEDVEFRTAGLKVDDEPDPEPGKDPTPAAASAPNSTPTPPGSPSTSGTTGTPSNGSPALVSTP